MKLTSTHIVIIPHFYTTVRADSKDGHFFLLVQFSNFKVKLVYSLVTEEVKQTYLFRLAITITAEQILQINAVQIQRRPVRLGLDASVLTIVLPPRRCCLFESEQRF